MISGEIMTLIEEAEKNLIIISPYYGLRKWYKLLHTFSALKEKNVAVEFYVRKGEIASINEIQEIGFLPVEIPNLHTKLYLNEKEAIVSSMNLNHASDTNSLDIAMKSETPEEYYSLFKYYERYIKKVAAADTVSPSEVDQGIQLSWKDLLVEKLRQKLGTDVRTTDWKGVVQIYTPEKYELTIFQDNVNILKIKSILTEDQFLYFKKNIQKFSGRKVEMLESKSWPFFSILTSTGSIKSISILELNKKEEATVIDNVISFVINVEMLKKHIGK